MLVSFHMGLAGGDGVLVGQTLVAYVRRMVLESPSSPGM